MTSDFDSIYLMPREISTIRSRSDVSMLSDFHNLYPIWSSPMKGISGSELVIEMAHNNCLGVLHRFDTLDQRMVNIANIFSYIGGKQFGIAIGVNNFDEEMRVAKFAVDYGATLILVDIANGYLPQIAECGKKLRGYFGSNVALATGNVVNYVGSEYVKESGFDFVRVGIGGGSVCITRNVTGVGRNTLWAIDDCARSDIHIVTDGGIKTSGDAAKAFAMGSDFVMLGSLLAYANETENKDGKMFGMASMTNHTLNNKEIKSIEGKDTQIDITQKRPLKEIINDFLWGIKSCCTYLGCNSYKDLYHKADIIPIDERY